MDGSAGSRSWMYKGTDGRVLVGSGMSEELNMNISLRQGSSLSPLMFIMEMELVSWNS